MGSTSSKTETFIEVVNRVMNSVTTNVITEKSNSVSSENKLSLECDADVAKKANDDCNAAPQLAITGAYNLAAIVIKDDPDTASAITKQAQEYKAPICDACSFEKISMTDNRSITINSNTITDIASKIQAELKANLQNYIDEKVKGGIGLTST
ncbi:hypothetical protein PC123_g19543 [Phytophthora cactorum]|nr:hypothetical protein PC123_g19543 [Phytophthora cactorum]